MKVSIVLILSILCINISFAQVKILETIDVDSVTSDFPVSFSFLQEGDWQFVGYFNKDRNLTVASRQISEKKWTYKTLPTKVGWDSHNAIVMAIDRENCIHISGNMHNDTLIYFKTEKPFQINSFQKVFPQVSAKDESSCTYPGFMKDADGRVIYSYRIGSSGKGNTINNVYDETTKTFNRLTDKPLFDGMDEMSAYSGGTIQADGYFHVAWVWRDTPSCETNHDLSYARSKDMIHWETMTGEKVELPITPLKKQFTVDAIPAKGGIINGGWTFFLDENKNPSFAFHKYDASGISQMFIAKSNGKEWQIKQVSDWNYRWAFSGPGSMESEIKINSAKLNPDNTIKVAYWHIKKGYGELIFDSKTLTRIEDKSVEIPKDNVYPVDLLKPNSGIEGMSVKWQNVRSSKTGTNDFYALRWETLGKQRFYKKPEKPVPPTMMRLYKIAK